MQIPPLWFFGNLHPCRRPSYGLLCLSRLYVDHIVPQNSSSSIVFLLCYHLDLRGWPGIEPEMPDSIRRVTTTLPAWSTYSDQSSPSSRTEASDPPVTGRPLWGSRNRPVPYAVTPS